MIAINEINKALRLGPRGGDLSNEKNVPQHRQAGLNAEALEGGPGLHHFVDTASMGLKNEQPWHRMAAYMLLAGRTNSEIAMAAGVIPQTVCILRAQRWFQELLATLANERGSDILGLLDSEAAASIATLVEIRDDPEAGARARLSAATTLLEQAHGKPIQKIISHSTRSNASPQDEMAEVERELANLQAIRKQREASNI